jgi:hypothetical protein
MYKIEKIDCNAFVVFLNAHQLTHSEFSIFVFIVLRWAVKRVIKKKKLVKMCTYMTFDTIVPLKVTTYPDQINIKLFLVNVLTNVYIKCIPRIWKHIVSDCFKKYCHFVFKNRWKVPVEKGLI